MRAHRDNNRPWHRNEWRFVKAGAAASQMLMVTMLQLMCLLLRGCLADVGHWVHISNLFPEIVSVPQKASHNTKIDPLGD
jgi:hypothetical protein